jgi:hypothetical protein
MKAMFEYCTETKVLDGLTERVRAYMRTYHLDLEDIAVLLNSEPQHIANWLIGAAPRPQSVHTLLFSHGTPPNVGGTQEAGIDCRA